MGVYVPGTNCVGSLVGFSPDDKEPVAGVTEYNLQNGFLTHSVTTKNFSCGSALLNDQYEIVGVHVRTNGPNKNGLNNQCVPLKILG